jgi:hypothetical protein
MVYRVPVVRHFIWHTEMSVLGLLSTDSSYASMPFNQTRIVHADLIRSERCGRSVYYFANHDWIAKYASSRRAGHIGVVVALH